MDPEQVAARLAVATAGVLAADATAVMLLAEDREQLVLAAGHPTPIFHAQAGGAEQNAFALAESPLDQETLRLGLALVEGADPSGQNLLPQGMSSALSVRLGSADRPLGVLHAYSKAPRRFTTGEIERLRSVVALAESALETARGMADLAQIEADKSQFIRVTTHELRSPITVSQSLIRTVLKGYAGPLTDKQREVFSRISGQLDFLESLVNDLLDLAASKAPTLATEAEPVLVNASVGRAMLVLQPRAEEKGVGLILRPCRDELEVWASGEGLDRIFVNLVGNAVKYTPPGGQVTVSLSQIADQIHVSVVDTGIGIPAEALPHLFEEFYRAPNARTAKTAGTGLGLAIVKELVSRYGGSIAVESTEGKGSTFILTFPRYQPEAEASESGFGAAAPTNREI